MLAAQSLPEFLWEHATLHAAYVRNRCYTKHLKMEMPYQGWFNQKLNVAHLHEFGAPVCGLFSEGNSKIEKCYLG
jgi:hypothetical protein